MLEYKICLDSINKVKKINSLFLSLNGDFTISCGRYAVDAKSIMGLFSLDLSRVLTLRAENLDISKEKFEPMIQEFITPKKAIT